MEKKLLNVLNIAPQKSLRGLMVLPISLSLLGAMFLAWGNAPGLMVSMIVFLVSGGCVIWDTFRQRKILSWELGIPAFYLFMFSIFPLLNQLIGKYDFKALQGVSVAIFIATAGLVSFKIGALLYSVIFKKVLPLPTKKDFTQYWPLTALNGCRTVWLTFIVGVIAHYYSFRYGYYGLNFVGIPEGRFASVAIMLSVLAETASIVAWVQYLKQNTLNNARWAILSWSSTIILFIFSFGANSKWFLIQPFVIIILAQYVTRRIINFRWLAVSAALYFVVAYPAISLLRASYALGAERDTILFVFLNVLTSPELWSVYTDNWSSLSAGIDRGLLQTFSTIIYQTGKEVDYVLGATYQQGVAALVPRFLWAGKPALDIGNFIGQQYGFIGPYDQITNVSPSQMGELYMNYGTLGVLIGMFAWGWLAAFVDDRLIGSGSSWMAIVCMLGIFWQESVIGQTVLPFLKTAVAVFIFFGTIKIIFHVAAFGVDDDKHKLNLRVY